MTNSIAEEAKSVSSDSSENSPLFIVGIGTSAGGLEALQIFFDNMQPCPSIAFVVVQHLSPDFKSMMVELLSKHTKMKVMLAEENVKLEGGNIYLIPKKKILTINNCHLKLQDKDPEQFLNLPIDIFFRSLGEDQKEQVIGVVLSGTGTDGTRGVRTIKEQGGMIMVQDPDSAKFDGMPNSAIATGLADYILPVDKMPAAILSYVEQSSGREPIVDIVETQSQYFKILELIRNETSLDFSLYKPATVSRRIERRMSINNRESLDDYLSLLHERPKEAKILQKELLIGVTKFFRDAQAFDVLEKKVIPKLYENKKPGDMIRIWVSACSTGEEAYSIGILLSEYQKKHKKKNPIKIFATDVDRNAIDAASKGIYPESIVSDVSKKRLASYFTLTKSDHYQVSKQLRELIVFAPHNIISDPPFNRLDMVVCRNLLIYFKSELQKKVLTIFHYSLKSDGGYLFLGNSETLGTLNNVLNVVDKKWKIYQKKAGSNLPRDEQFLPPSLSENTTEKVSPHNISSHNPNKVSEKLNEILVDEFAPMCIIINEKDEIIHVTGGASKFLRIPEKRLSLNVLKMLPERMSVQVSTAIKDALKKNTKVTYKGIKFSDNSEHSYFDLNVKIIPETYYHEKLIMLVFYEVAKQQEGNVEEMELDSSSTKQRHYLEEELKYTKANLQATVEELETSNEELQASNEELLASNEELQSTNEELQSVNEELYTVNAELQEKIKEVTELNDDVNNLLKSTEIGTIFLDNELIIRKFTPAIKEQFNILDHDVSRPITHITHNLKNNNTFEIVGDLINSEEIYEEQVENKNGKWFLMRIIPYNTHENEQEGLIITFVEISKLRMAQQALEDSERRYKEIFENTSVAIWEQEIGELVALFKSLQKQGIRDIVKHVEEQPDILKACQQAFKIKNVNNTSLQLFGVDDRDEIIDNLSYFNDPEAHDSYMALLSNLFHGKNHFELETSIINKQGEQKKILVRTSMPKTSGDKQILLLTLIDITNIKQLEVAITAKNDELTRSNASLEEFAYVSTHDLRGPVVNLLSLLKMFDQHALKDDNAYIYNKIDKSVHQLNTTLNDLIEVVSSKKTLDEKKQKIQFQTVYQEVIDSIEEQVTASSAQITTDFSEIDTVVYPPNHLKSIFQNLITNAIKYSKEDTVPIIEIKTRDEGEFIVLTIKDNGIGIDLERSKHKLFGLFKRMTDRSEGKGIGLYITKSQVESQGGKIEVNSVPDVGSTFEVYLRKLI